MKWWDSCIAGRVDCSSDNMVIVIQRSYLNSLGLSANDLYVDDHLCRPSISSTEVMFSFPLDTCGTAKEVWPIHVQELKISIWLSAFNAWIFCVRLVRHPNCMHCWEACLPHNITHSLPLFSFRWWMVMCPTPTMCGPLSLNQVKSLVSHSSCYTWAAEWSRTPWCRYSTMPGRTSMPTSQERAASMPA